jgi:hypothetical protein
MQRMPEMHEGHGGEPSSSPAGQTEPGYTNH